MLRPGNLRRPRREFRRRRPRAGGGAMCRPPQRGGAAQGSSGGGGAWGPGGGGWGGGLGVGASGDPWANGGGTGLEKPGRRFGLIVPHSRREFLALWYILAVTRNAICPADLESLPQENHVCPRFGLLKPAVRSLPTYLTHTPELTVTAKKPWEDA